MLLKEEMRHVLQFFDSEVSRWNHLATTANFGDDRSKGEILEGWRVYTYWQANIRVAMCRCCARKWNGISDSLVLAGEFKNNAGFVEYR